MQDLFIGREGGEFGADFPLTFESYVTALNTSIQLLVKTIAVGLELSHDFLGVVSLQFEITSELILWKVNLLIQHFVLYVPEAVILIKGRRVLRDLDSMVLLLLGGMEICVRCLPDSHGAIVLLLHFDLMAFLLHAFC